MPSKKTFLELIKEILEKEKQSIESSLKSFATKDKKLADDWDVRFPNLDDDKLEESADEVEEYGTLLPIEFSLENRLKDINSALKKIKKGKYGKCEKCQKEIAKKRLLACPEARTCDSCLKNKGSAKKSSPLR